MANKKIWVLTYEVNEYNQYGEYFIAAFDGKPNHQRLANALINAKEMPSDIMAGIAFLEHLLKGGGRQDNEDTWYNLDERELK